MKNDERDVLALREATATPAPWQPEDVERLAKFSFEDADLASRLRYYAKELIGESRRLETLRDKVVQAVAHMRFVERDGGETALRQLGELADILEREALAPTPVARLVRRCGKCGMDTTVTADDVCRRCGHDGLFGIRIVW